MGGHWKDKYSEAGLVHWPPKLHIYSKQSSYQQAVNALRVKPGQKGPLWLKMSLNKQGLGSTLPGCRGCEAKNSFNITTVHRDLFSRCSFDKFEFY